MSRQRLRVVLLAAWLLFWLLLIITAVQDNARNGGTEHWKPVLWQTSSGIAASCLMWVQWRCSGDPRRDLASPWRWFGRQVMWLPMYWICFVPIAFGLRHAVYTLMHDTYPHAPWGETYLYEDIKLLGYFFLFNVVLFGIFTYQAMLAESARAAQGVALLRQARLQQMTAQMQPHFLFNALNTISSLMHEDVARADAALMRLAELLRTSLDVGEQDVTTFATELRLVRAYAHLMEERFIDRVSLRWHIDDRLLPCPVPVMSLQPLLENVFKHTVERRREHTTITISAQRDGDVAVFHIDDDAGQLQAEGDAGLGLSNLRRRLAMLHGDAAALRLTQLTPAGVRAEMRLPCAY
ncbi:sensor histidine kinase [Massilia sp. S19_KUP03_FR1]|uniref:sensor histidine kinase n=1 Tax=Massilia sp. S19_KUP03_FR1 TaxID=3025503 RepID=UPI002FCD922E